MENKPHFIVHAPSNKVSDKLERCFMEACYNIKQQRISQGQLASQMGLAPSTLSGRMQDWTKFKVSEFVDLCNIANVEL